MTEKEHAAIVAKLQSEFPKHWGDDYTSMLALHGAYLGPSPDGEYIGIEFRLAVGVVRVSLHCLQVKDFLEALVGAAERGLQQIEAHRLAGTPSRPEGATVN